MDNMNIDNLKKQARFISDNVNIIKKFLLSEFYLTEKIKIIMMSAVAIIIMTLGFILDNQTSFAILLSLVLLSSLYYFSLKVNYERCAHGIRECDNLLYDIMIFNETEILSEEKLIEFQDRADELEWGVK